MISSGRYVLLPKWKDIFKIASNSNSESIFEIDYDGRLGPGGGGVHTLFSLPSGSPAATPTG